MIRAYLDDMRHIAAAIGERGNRRMGKHFYESLGHLLVAADGVEKSDALKTALKTAGGSEEFVARAGKLAHAAEDLVTEKIDVCSEDRIREHATHAAATEVEMWLQSVALAAKKSDLDGGLLSAMRAKDLHAHEHTATVGAQAIRALALIATNPQIGEALGEERTVRDMLNKGQAVLKRLYTTTDIRLAPMKGERRHAIFGKLEDHQVEMEAWLAKASSFAVNIAENEPTVLGWFGIVPEGVGLPVGGTAFGVTLHERGQTDAPDPARAKVCSGWSIGRQGNRENLGKGFSD